MAPDRTPGDAGIGHLLLFLAPDWGSCFRAVAVDAADLRLQQPCRVPPSWEGRRERVIPLLPPIRFRSYGGLCRERGVGATEHPTRLWLVLRASAPPGSGATHVLRRAVKTLRLAASALMSPHVLRRTLAMQLLRARVDLVTIKPGSDMPRSPRPTDTWPGVEMMRRTLASLGVTTARYELNPHRCQILRLLQSSRNM